MADTEPAEAAPPAKPAKVLVPRHRLATRITHWINVVAFLLMLLSGLAIFNAHPALYWGQVTQPDKPWLAMTAVPARGGKLEGHTRVLGADLKTTGFLGASKSPITGEVEARGFPSWLTVPSYKSLVDGRHWHFFFAWVLVINGLIYLVAGLLNRHFRNDFAITKQDIRDIPHEIVTHAQLKFPKGEEATRYNVLQKLAYGGVVFVLFPLIILAGLTLSPRLDAGFHLPDLFFGRQSARSIHFIAAFLLVGFLFVHLAMVVASGTWNNIRSMITGRYAIEVEDKPEGPANDA